MSNKTKTSNTLTISQIGAGNSATADWEIKNWERDFDLLLNTANCPIDIFQDNGDPPVYLNFSLQKFTNLDHIKHIVTFVSLEQRVYSKGRLPFILQVHVQPNDISPAVNVTYVVTQNLTNITLCKEWIKVSTETERFSSPFIENHIQGDTLKLTITATVIHVNDTHFQNYDSQATGSTKVDALGTLASDIKMMYGATDNFPDIKMETKDNMTLSGHRFMLSARSPVFRKMFQENAEDISRAGILKVTVNDKPLIVVLHWMYTEELHKNAEKVVGELVEFAVQFEIKALFETLDRELATFCTSDNMFRLFEVAKKNNMTKAIGTISDFIKRQL